MLSAVQVILVAKACPTLSIGCFSRYLIVHFYFNAFDVVCSQPSAISGSITGSLETWPLFRKCLRLGVGGKQAANGM